VSKLGVAAVTGLSGEGAAGAANTYISDPLTKIATEAKHYAAYGFGGRDGGSPAEVSEYTLHDVYGARFQTECCTRGCHWIPHMFA
jgi:beta-glucosidase-like glycosyl hydrolase